MAGSAKLELFGRFQILGVPLDLSAELSAETIFKARLGDLSLGEIVRYLVHLAEPSYELKLSPPWDVLNGINLRNLTFQINLTQKKLGFTYENLGIDLGFVRLDVMELWYKRSPEETEKSVEVSLYGRVLDKSFDYPKHPLSWDLLTQPPPQVPAAASPAFELHYLGLGQHVSLRDSEKLGSMAEVMEALQDSYRELPPDGNPLDDLTSFRFDASAGWLIGTRFSVLGTVDLAAVFNDPKLYGIRVELSGERAKALAGLEFEILYRKVTDEVGVYHVELELPDAMRQLEFGAFSLTLPSAVLDIYTNGNFRVDLGFPYDLDFSRSFTIQAVIGPVPVIGAGGFYLGVFGAGISSDVPRITNGRFAPVVAFGLGLQVGVGKTFNKGILSAGITIAIEGTLEGVLAFFEPDDPSLPKDAYFRISGTVALVGHVYGSVDFGIIKASVDVYAYVSVSATFEAYAEAVLVLEAGVKVVLRVKVLFFHIKLSFSATIRESLTVGTKGHPPWIVEPGLPSERLLRARTRPMMATRTATLATPLARVQATGLVWKGARVADEARTLDLYVHPAVTLGFPDDRPARVRGAAEPGQSEAAVQLVALLFTPIRAAEDPAPEVGPPAEKAACFVELAESLLRWAVETIRSGTSALLSRFGDPVVTRAELQCVLDDLVSGTPPGPVGFRALVDFLRENFRFRLNALPADPESQSRLTAQGLALFPMPPFLQLATSDTGHGVDFACFNACTAAYREMVSEYFDRLAAAPSRPAAESESPKALRDAPTGAEPDSMAALLFVDYFLMILRQVVGAALELFGEYEYTASPGDSLSSIAAWFAVAGEDPVGEIAVANQDSDSFFGEGAVLSFSNLRAQVRAEESLAALAGRFGTTPLAVAEHCADTLGLLREGARIDIPAGQYVTRPGDTRDSITGRFFTSEAELVAANPDFDWTLPENENEELHTGATLRLPSVRAYAIREDDTFRSIATHFGVGIEALLNEPSDVEGETNADARDLLVTLASLELPPVSRAVNEGDTLLGIARSLGLDVRDVVKQNDAIAAGWRTVRIPNAQELSWKDVTRTLHERNAYEAAADSVARFLLGGLRLPDPEKWASADARPADEKRDWADVALYPMYNLSGQQWDAPATPTVEYGISLSRSTAESADACTPPEIVFGADSQASELSVPLTPEDVAQIAAFGGRLAEDPPFAPDLLALTRFPPFAVVPLRFPLGEAIPWQAATPPSYGQDDPATAPRILPLPRALREKLRAQPQRPAPLRLMVAPSAAEGAPAAKAREIESRAWVTRLTFGIRRIPDPADPDRFVPSVYEVFSTDLDGRRTLLELIESLRGANEPNVRIDLLYDANPTDPAGGGLRSDVVEPSTVVLLKANLSTYTRPPTVQLMLLRTGAPEPEILSDASLEDPIGFLTLLWEASIVNSGGYYLFYQIGGEGGEELPPQLFNQNPIADLTVLVTVLDADGRPTLPTLPFHNAVVSTENLGDAGAVVFVEPPLHTVQAKQEGKSQTLVEIAAALGVDVAELAEANATVPNLLRPGATLALPNAGSYVVQVGDDLLDVALLEPDESPAAVAATFQERDDVLTAGTRLYTGESWVVRRGTVPPGAAGIRLLRTDPDPVASEEAAEEASLTGQEDPESRLKVLFNLLGFHIAESASFEKSSEGLPASPAAGKSDAPNGQPADPTRPETPRPWEYHRILAVAGSARRPGSAGAGDPFAGLGEEVTLALDLHDVFGNRSPGAGGLPPASQTLRYSDAIVSLAQWPSVSATYDFHAVGSRPHLDLFLAFDPGRYVPLVGEPFEGPLDKAQADLDRYQWIAAQIAQDDLGFQASFSLDRSTAEEPQRLDKATFVDFVTGVRRYLATVRAMKQALVRTTRNTHLEGVARAYGIGIAALTEANADSEELLVAGEKLIAPELEVTLQNDSLAGILARTREDVTPAQLAERNREAPLQPGVSICVAAGEYETRPGDTLASISRRKRRSIHSLAEQNQHVPNLFPPGTQLLLGSHEVTISPGDTLRSIALHHGLSLTHLATANAWRREILREGFDLVLPGHVQLGDELGSTHRVLADDSFASVARAKGVSVSALATANRALDGLLQPERLWTCRAQPDLPRRKLLTTDNDTLDTLLEQFRAFPELRSLTLAELAEQNAKRKNRFVRGGPIVVPPRDGHQSLSIVANQPSPIFPVEVSVHMTREETLVDPAFRGRPGVACAATALSPHLRSGERAAGKSSSQTRPASAEGLREFAGRFEEVFPDLRLATAADRGGSGDLRSLTAVKRPRYAIDSTPYFFAPRPLSNTLWSSKPDEPVPIHAYQSGQPLSPEPKLQAIHGVDLDAWGRRYLEAVDRLLSPEHAVAAQRANPEAFKEIVRAKEGIARGIRDQVTEVVEAPEGGPGPDPDEAAEALYQRVLIRLSEAYNVDTLVQLPVKVVSDWEDAGTAPRLYGRAVGASYSVPADGTIAQVAEHFEAPVAVVARLIAEHRFLLRPGASVPARARGSRYQVERGDTLADVAKELGIDVAALASDQANRAGLLREGATIDLVTNRYTTREDDVLGTLVRYLEHDLPLARALQQFWMMNRDLPGLLRARSEIVVNKHIVQRGDTLRSVAEETLASGSREPATQARIREATKALVRANWREPGILREGARIGRHTLKRHDTFESLEKTLKLRKGFRTLEGLEGLLRPGAFLQLPTSRRCEVRAGDTLAKIVSRLRVPYQDVLAVCLETPRILEPGVTVRCLSRLPGFSLSEAKVKLRNGRSYLTFFFQTASNRRFSNVALDLRYQITDLEYDVRNVEWAGDYQASDWLTFLAPTPDVSIGEIQIPIALRAFPLPPSMLDQSIAPSRTGPDAYLEQVRSFDYQFRYAYETAAQDRLYAGEVRNQADGLRTELMMGREETLPEVLAQYDAIAGDLWADLSLLADPEALAEASERAEVVRNAVQVFAGLASRVARTWQSWERPATAPVSHPMHRVRAFESGGGLATVSVCAINPAAAELSSPPEVELAGHVALEAPRAERRQRSTPFASMALVRERSGARAFEEEGDASDEVVLTHRVRGLDVMEVQNIQGTVSVERNVALLPDPKRPTRDQFVYRLEDVRPPSKAVPQLAHRHPFDMTRLRTELSDGRRLVDRLANFFADLLGVDAESSREARVRVAVSYAFDLLDPFRSGRTQEGATRVLTSIPILMTPATSFQPRRDLTQPDGLCHRLADSLATWLRERGLAKPEGTLEFDVAVFSTLSDRPQPLLELSEVQLRLCDVELE